MRERLHTPEGVRDIYGIECSRKLAVQEQLHHILHLYGYHDIQTPLFEYADVFRKEIGTIPAKDLYRFFDKDGNMLTMRPDITPSIARATATLFESEEVPIRLCYVGNTFINHSNYQGRLRETTQLGAELIGIDDIESDAEMLALTVEALKATGLEEFQLNVGNMEYFHGLLDIAALSEELEERVRELLNNRNYFGVEEILSQAGASKKIQESFAQLGELTGGYEILEKALNIAPNATAVQAVKRLECIYQILKTYGVEKYISFDFGMCGNYGYYTGIIFRGYTFETGDAIVKGGRYDHLLEKFGKTSPSIGFAIVVDELLNAMERQKVGNYRIASHTMVLYDDTEGDDAISLAKQLRVKGKNAEIMKFNPKKTLDDYKQYGKNGQSTNLIYLQKNKEILSVNLIAGTQKVIKRGTQS